MAHGKNIRIYLADGSATGIRHAEVVNWTGQAVACAKHRVPDLKNWDEAKRPGVYFLFGLEDGATTQRAYIGEGELVLTRLSSHVRGKEFWNEVVLFTSKDQLLTKAHVKYLESRLIDLAESAGRYTLENGKSSDVPSLPRGDRDAMEEFIDNLRVLLGALGHRILEPMTAPVKPATASSIDDVLLHFSARDARAHMQVADDGYVVTKGSTAVKDAADGLSTNYVQFRDRLVQEGVLVRKGNVLEFERDHLFTSPSTAATIVSGSSRNGREVWKDDAGRTLKEIEEATWSDLGDEAESTVFPSGGIFAK